MKKKGFKSLKGLMMYLVVMIIVSAFIASSAYATNGYFAHGYSTKNKALAGAGVALPLDALSASVNPAGMVFVGKRFDFGIALFNPNREYTVEGTPSPPPAFGLMPGTVESDSKWFLIPSFGYNRPLDENSSIGVSIFGNGGMNTDYDTNTYWDPDSSTTGVDLMQLFILPTYARNLHPKHAVGISAVLAYQSFEAKGLGMFGGFSSDASKLTNNDHEKSYGYGARIGYMGEVLPKLHLGASYQTKVFMTELDDYAGLFAEQGDFDIPANWTVGLAYKAAPSLTFVADIQKVYYSEVNSINNSFMPNLMTSQLGNNDGAGFGWENMTIYKIGVQWQRNEDLTLRVGYSYGEQPIPDIEVMFNIIAPGVIEQHATVGFTKAVGNNNEINFALTRAFSKSIKGPNPLDPAQTIELKMDQWDIAFAYAWKF